MDEELRKEFPYEVRVNFKGFRRYKGFSDLIETFCCSAKSSYYVIFPRLGYEGYFEKRDVLTKQ